MGEVTPHRAEQGVFPRTEEIQERLVEVCQADHAFQDFEFCFDFFLNSRCLGLIMDCYFLEGLGCRAGVRKDL